MNIEELEKLLEENSAKDENDDREIIKFKNNVEYGNEIGSILSTIKGKIYEVFIHVTVEGKAYSKLLYKTFDKIEDATNYYNKIEKYIIEYNIKSIIDEIKNPK